MTPAAGLPRPIPLQDRSDAPPRERTDWMLALMRELFPLFRTIAGEGLRATLRRLARDLPLQIREVASGTQVLDWTIPNEWSIRAAHVSDSAGRRIVDLADSNLHVVSYSRPVDATMSLAELQPHLHSLPEHPDWIPYRTSFFSDSWGFCLPHRQRSALTEQPYRVVIDAELRPGSLSYGEAFLPGDSPDEILVFTHCCHPSLANDNLSGIAVAAAVARELSERPRRLGYRFVFAPTTIGSIAWLAASEAILPRVRGGLVLANLGDTGALRYKRSRSPSLTDAAAAHVLARCGEPHELIDFIPWGYDERQFCSPGFDLPMGRLTRSPEGGYPQYHTSADDLSLIDPVSLARSVDVVLRILGAIERERRLVNLSPRGEPQLGKRGLYRAGQRAGHAADSHMALLWVLNQSDGSRGLLEIAQRAGLPFEAIDEAAVALERAGLVREAAPDGESDSWRSKR